MLGGWGWRGRAPGPHAHGNTARQVGDGLRTGVWGQQKQSNDPRNNQHNSNTPTTGRRSRANGTSRHIQHSPSTPTTGLRGRGNDTSRSTGGSGRQKAATRRNMRREERVTGERLHMVTKLRRTYVLRRQEYCSVERGNGGPAKEGAGGWASVPACLRTSSVSKTGPSGVDSKYSVRHPSK